MDTQSLVLENKLIELDSIREFLDTYCEKLAIPEKTKFEINLIIEELFTNIVFYGYDDKDRHEISLKFIFDNNILQLEITDNGMYFNPIEKEKPSSLSKPIIEREVGGLGIHFVKTLVDELSYKRIDEKNILTLIKKL